MVLVHKMVYSGIDSTGSVRLSEVSAAQREAAARGVQILDRLIDGTGKPGGNSSCDAAQSERARI